MKKLFFILLIFMLSLPQGFTQNNPTIDSLKQLLKTAKYDTIKLRLLNEMVEAEADDKIWSIYNEQLKSTAEKLLITKPNAAILKIAKKYLAASLNNIGFIYDIQGNIPRALEYYGKSLQLQEEIGDKHGIAESLNNIGLIYNNQGDIPKALEYYSNSLQLQEKIGDKYGIATLLNNIGAIYHNQGDIPKALEYYGKSLQLREEIGDKQGIAYSLNNIGDIYQNQANAAKSRQDIVGSDSLIKKALEYYSKSLQLQEEIGNKEGIANSLNNIGFIYQDQVSAAKSRQDFVGSDSLIKKALEYYNKSLQLQEKIGSKRGIAYSLTNIGRIYLTQHQLTSAKSYYKKAYQFSKELGYPELIELAANGLKKVYEQQGNYKLAYHYHQVEILMRDSIQSEENYKASVQQRAKYEYEKKAATDSIVNAKEKEIKDSEIAQQQAEIKAKRLQQYGLIGGLILVVIFAAFVFNRLKVTQQQKRIIETQKTEVEQQKQLVEKQKEVVEEKQKEIIASIRYARRIQDALLTSQTYIERNLKRLRNDL